MDDISELKNVSQAANTEKITERKKQVEKLLQLLTKSAIIKALDKHAEERRKGKRSGHTFAWEDLFSRTCRIMEKEMEYLGKAKEALSATALSNREKKKQDICGLFKTVVRLADKRGKHNLKASEVVSHVLAVVGNRVNCAQFGMDMTVVLLKDVLQVRAYWAQLRPKTWQDMLNQYCKLLREPPPRFDRVVIARILHVIITGAIQQCDIRGRDILPLLESYFEKIRTERAMGVLEQMVAVVNILSQNLAKDGRIQVCRLGENLLVPLLYLWTHRPSERLKDEVVDFLRLQMIAHHPRGVQTEEEGAFAVDWQKWKSDKKKLYEAIYDDLQEISVRNRFVTGCREVGLKDNYVDLAADVCHQIFLEKRSVLDVTQAPMLHTQVGGSVKRRRVLTGWGMLLDAFTEHTSSLCIPWLHVLLALIQKYPTSIPEEEFLRLLNALHVVQAETKQIDTLRCVLQGLKEFANSQHLCQKDWSAFTVSQCNATWSKVWASTLRTLSLHQAEREGFQLLATVVRTKLVNPDNSLWTLFLPNVCHVSEDAALFLASYLRQHDLPERYQPPLLASLDIASDKDSHPLRVQLLDWLLPNTDDLGQSTLPISAGSKVIDPSILGELLVTLTLRDSRNGTYRDRSKDTEGPLKDIEKVYLQTSFDLPLEGSVSLGRNEKEVSKDKTEPNSCLGDVQKHLDRLVNRDCFQVLSLAEPTVSGLQQVTWQCGLLVQMLSSQLRHQVITDTRLSQTDFSDKIKELLKRTASWFTDLVHQEGNQALDSVVTALSSLFTLSDNSVGKHSVGQMLQDLTPGKLISQLVDLVKNKKEGSRSMERDEVDLFDTSINNMDVDFHVRSEVEDDFFGGRNTAAEEVDDFTAASSTALESLLSSKLLSEDQGIRLKILNLLCQWLGLGSTRMTGLASGRTEHPPAEVMRFLQNLLDESTWDPARAYDLQLLQCMVNGLTTSMEWIECQDIHDMAEALWLVGRQHRRDQEICVTTLELLTRLVPYLATDPETMTTPDYEEACRSCVRFIPVFSVLTKDLQYSHKTRTALYRLMATMMKTDPLGKWTSWRKPGQDDEREKIRLSNHFCHLLEDNHHGIRLFAAANIHLLFVKETKMAAHQEDKNQLEEMFDSLYMTLTGALAIQGRHSVDEQKDESINRTSSLLHTLSVIARVSTIFEKKATFSFCQVFKEAAIDIELIVKVLSSVAQSLSYPSLETFMSSHLPYMLKIWLYIKYTVGEFPHQLFGYAHIADFYKDHKAVVVAMLLMQKDLTDIHPIAEQLNMETKALLRECIPKIVVHILPLYAATSLSETSQVPEANRRCARAKSRYEMLESQVTPEVIDRSILDNMVDITVDILKTLHDSPANKSRLVLPEPNPPFFNKYVIEATLDYLCKGSKGSSSSDTIVSWLAKTQDGIQKVLLALHTAMTSAHRPFECYRILSMYQLFVCMLLREFDDKLGGSFAFVLRDVLFTLLNLLQEVAPQPKNVPGIMEEAIANGCLDLLSKTCEKAVNTCYEELGRFLPTITSLLIPYAEESHQLGQKCLQLLELLLEEHHVELAPAISLLDPLPDKPAFRQLRRIHHKHKYHKGAFNLRQEVCHFVGAHGRSVTQYEKQLSGLQFLQEKLSSLKDELAGMVRECSEKQAKAPLVMLMRELVQLAKSPCESVAQEAAMCLAEIGPVDLSVVALERRHNNLALTAALGKFEGDTKSCQYCYVFHMLDGYLIDPSVTVVSAASSVLKRLLATKTGLAFYGTYNNNMDNAFKYLHPFKPAKNKNVRTLPEPDRSLAFFKGAVNSSAVWCPEHTNHSLWITNLVCSLIDSGAIYDELLRLVTQISKVKNEFCEVILPFLIHDILLNGSDDHRQILSQQMQNFFSSHCTLAEQSASKHRSPFNSQGDCTPSISGNQASVRVMLSVVQYLRQQDRPSQGRQKVTAWDKNLWLDLDFLQVAKAASSCSSYFTTMLYSEIWCNMQRDKGPGPESQPRLSQSSQGECHLVDSLTSMSHPGNINLQQLMLEAYRAIGDPDAIYGCGAGRLADTNSRIQTYEHEGEWGKAVGSYDLELSEPASASTQLGLLQAMQKLGMGHVLDKYLQGLTQGGTDQHGLNEFQYEAAWRNMKWDLAMPTRFSSDCGYQEAVYSGMWAIKEADEAMLSAAAASARTSVIETLRESSLESVCNLYPSLSKLRCLKQIEEAGRQVLSGGDLEAVLERWHSQDCLLHPNYDYVEDVLMVRCRLLRLAMSREKQHGGETGMTSTVHSALTHHLITYARKAREARRHQVAERAIHELKEILSHGSDKQLSWQLEEAQLFWARGEENTAKHVMKGLIHTVSKIHEENDHAAQLYPQCLGLYGNWLAETRTEHPSIIIDDYLRPAVDLLTGANVEDSVALDAYLSLGRYADAQYQQVVDYMVSPTFEAKEALVKRAKEEAEVLRSTGDKSSRYLRMLDKQRVIDELEMSALDSDKQRFLRYALQSYIKCLTAGDAHNLRIFRLISLWFDNNTNQEVNELIQEGAVNIQSYKFLPLMYQLAARMSSSPGSSRFQPVLEEILQRTVQDHPHHTVAIILALAHANKDAEVGAKPPGAKGRLSRGSAANKAQDEEDRVKAARTMVARLKQSHRADVISDMERLSLAYIELANLNVDQHKKETKALKLPTSLKLVQLKRLTNVAVPTAETPVDPSCTYADIVYVQGFQATFKLAGGINLPKIISCLGSDGQPRRQLVKGKDDLRQDAVMQQVFGMVNHLLKRDPNTRSRNLLIRTYKVIPLSQRSGLLEWCEGTLPIGEYLIGITNGAHGRYRPQDLKSAECRKTLAAAHEGKSGKSTRYEAYMYICERFQPVFRHFFMEKFVAPAEWYQRRRAYTHSVATNSVVGYILGLGDRHVQNILIDCQSAELIHIDLGVAFEQGRILPTPETVPFRLTRDIVDGMGVAGVEGVFRRCCEATLEVLRSSGEALLTILTVLLYDPLYAWTISPLQAYALQSRRDSRPDPEVPSEINTTTSDLLALTHVHSGDDQSEPVNKLAERVILRLRQKLAGVEEGVHMSVSGHVNHLIQAATDPHSLCRLFPGWQPYV